MDLIPNSVWYTSTLAFTPVIGIVHGDVISDVVCGTPGSCSTTQQRAVDSQAKMLFAMETVLGETVCNGAVTVSGGAGDPSYNGNSPGEGCYSDQPGNPQSTCDSSLPAPPFNIRRLCCCPSDGGADAALAARECPVE